MDVVVVDSDTNHSNNYNYRAYRGKKNHNCWKGKEKKKRSGDDEVKTGSCLCI